MLKLLSQQSLVVNLLVAYFGFYLALLVHELGHYVVNRHYGFKVEKVRIGVGPSLKIKNFEFGLFPTSGVNISEIDEEIINGPNQNVIMFFKTMGGIFGQTALMLVLSFLPSSYFNLFVSFINMVVMFTNMIPLSSKTDGFKAFKIFIATIRGKKVLETLN